ncbi:MAG TPA: histone deacetylase [Syntrophomonas sp.]|nr:histone deacetylase [Syntrophomonas sp.]HRW12507.1 histone deacetylase [Syntrophomonas sp.]
MKNTGVIFFPAFDWAISPTHPEREERLLYTRDQIFEEGIMDLPNIHEFKPRLADKKDIARVHFCVPNVEAQITDAHLVSAGSALVIADAVLRGEVDNGFSIARPPGHHAMTVAHGNRGFCNINNEAIMIEYIRKQYGLRKIAVVDTDVHHGDGSQEIFYDDPDILFISFHQDGRTLYPGTGFVYELGGPMAWGSTINIPLPPQTTDEGILRVLDKLVLPVLEEFAPELIVNSAGQDNHYTDPLANMRFTARGYAELNRRLAPDIAVLEGGYSVETALPYVNMALLMAMAGIDYANLHEPDYRPEAFKESAKNLEYIEQIISHQLFNFRSRQQKIEENRKKYGHEYGEHQQIYYDTEGISEDQARRLRICPACPGWRRIDSSARHRDGKTYHVFCISIPTFACPECQKEAFNAYQDMAMYNHHYDYIYLQDRAKDRYIALNVANGREEVYE